MRRRNIFTLIAILVVLGSSLWVLLPIDSERFGRQGISLGLDLRGGSYLVYQADLTVKDPAQTDQDAMAGVMQKIERRANDFGVTEPIIQQQGVDRVIVQLPGVRDINQAIDLIGQTALLEFKEILRDEAGQIIPDEDGNPQWVPAVATGSDGVDRTLTGAFLRPNAQVVVHPTTGSPQVAFEWDSEGAVLFQAITTRLVGLQLGIFLDSELISAPTVRQVITDRGVIDNLSLGEARNLAIQLNSGSLDVPLEIIQRFDVDPTLGADSLQRSLVAGFIGLALIMFFMIAYYRVPGIVAALSLAMYGVFVMAVFKMIPVTLTLPGIAGFIVSLGMAIDANVLIFERLKDELRSGRTLGAAVEVGFNRAWSAIRDSNITTLIACAVLFWLGGTLGAFMVRGFAVTLFLGILISMLTALIVSRTLLRSLVATRLITNPRAYGVKRK